MFDKISVWLMTFSESEFRFAVLLCLVFLLAMILCLGVAKVDKAAC